MFAKLFGIVMVVLSGLLITSAHQKLTAPIQATEPQVLGSSSTVNLSDRPVNLNQLHADINSKRATFGLAELKPDAELTDIAQTRASDMAANMYFAHQSRQGFYHNIMDEQGITRGFSCENLALIFAADHKQALADWLASESHKNCLSDNRHTAAGYAAAAVGKVSKDGREQEAYIVVAIFAELSSPGI